MQLFMKISIKNLRHDQLKLLRFEESLTKSFRNPFFLIAVFLVAACSPELQEQEGVVERVANPVETKFEKWYETEHKEILETPSNARMHFDPSVRLTYRYKEVDWSSYKKLNLPGKLEVYEFEFLAPNVVVPFDFKEKFGYEEALKRSKHTLLIFAQGDQVVKSFVVRYYFSGEKAAIDDFQKVNYDAVDKNWKGEIDLYSLNEIHLVSFDMVIGQVIGTETMKLGSQDDIHPSLSASTTCTTIWTPGPCEPIPQGVICYDTIATYCYNSSPPLMTGFPEWNGSGGFAPGGTGGPAVQSICDFDPACIPHPDLDTSEDVYVLPEFEVNYKKEMSTRELQIFENMDRFSQLKYLSNASDALNLAQGLYPGDQRDTCADAFRHAFFSGLNVSSLGYSLAKQLGDAHEEKPDNQLSISMDLYNNSVGLNKANAILNSGVGGSFSQILWQTLVKIGYNGGFKVVYEGQLIFGSC
jgi:hypothetical protein